MAVLSPVQIPDFFLEYRMSILFDGYSASFFVVLAGISAIVDTRSK